MNIYDLMTSGDKNDELSVGLELSSTLKAGYSGATDSETLNSFSTCGLQGKTSSITASDRVTAIHLSCGVIG